MLISDDDGLSFVYILTICQPFYKELFVNWFELFLQAKLAKLQQERDMAVTKSKQLDKQIQALCLHYG